MKKSRKIFLWIAIILGLVLIFVAALAFTAPRVINLESVRNAIEATISRELGGSLTYDRADLVILPRPGVVVRNPYITIPGTLDAKLGSLKIYPSILPLFAGRLEISRVLLDRPDMTVILSKETEKGKKSAIETVLGVAAAKIPDIEIGADHGALTVQENGQELLSLQDVKTRFTFLALRRESEENPASTHIQTDFQIVGNAAFTIKGSESLPGPVSVSIARFEALPRTLTITKARGNLLDMSLTLSGKFDDYLTELRKADITFSGTIREDTIRWLRDITLLPPELTIHAPLAISQARFRWDRRGTFRMEGNAKAGRGLTLTFDLLQEPGRFFAKKLHFKDRESDALLSVDAGEKKVDVAFTGNITQSTLNALFEHDLFRFGWLKGDFRASILYDQPAESTAHGALEGEGLVIPYVLKTPFSVDRLYLRASGSAVFLEPVVLSVGKDIFTVTGSVGAAGDGLLLDLDVAADDVQWGSLSDLFSLGGETKEAGPKLPVRGVLRMAARSLSAGRFKARPVRADIELEDEKTTLDVKEAVICGISLPGKIILSPDETQLDLKPLAMNLDLGSSMDCLTAGKLLITGSSDIIGRLTAQGAPGKLIETLSGTLGMTAKKGRIYHDFVVVRTIAYLNVTDLLRGKYDNMERDGVPYDSFSARAKVKGGVLSFQDAVLKSEVMNIVARGNVNLPLRTMDITLLAAPFTTIDAVVSRIPLVGHILGGSLVTIPIRIKGPLDNPGVTTLQASAIGEGLLGIMKRTLTLPFTIIEPIIPKKKDEQGP